MMLNVFLYQHLLAKCDNVLELKNQELNLFDYYRIMSVWHILTVIFCIVRWCRST